MLIFVLFISLISVYGPFTAGEFSVKLVLVVIFLKSKYICIKRINKTNIFTYLFLPKYLLVSPVN